MLSKSSNHNPNYCASIVKIQNINKHPNADKLNIAYVYGNAIVTGSSTKEGDLVCYFPLECCICKEFLTFSNSYRDAELNVDKSKKGMFEHHGRVRACLIRSQKSEGYIIPITELHAFAISLGIDSCKITEKDVGTDFDQFYNIQICKKYVPANQRTPNNTSKKSKGNVKKYESKLVEKQFRFHEDTEQLKRNAFKLNPDDIIAITNKLHGSNFIVSNVLVKRKLTLRDKVAKFLGVQVQETEYGNLYASRTVIKNQNFETPNSTGHFYDADVWKIASDKLFPFLKEGITVTGELVGYTPSGKFIQNGYDYSCAPGQLDFYVFKITYTSPSGDVYVFDHRQVQAWCKQYDVKTPETFYYGKAKDLFPELDTDTHWNSNFVKKLEETFLEKKCHLCKNDVWAEGVIVKIEKPHQWDAYKLKSWNFLGYESAQLDKGEIGIEETSNDIV